MRKLKVVAFLTTMLASFLLLNGEITAEALVVSHNGVDVMSVSTEDSFDDEQSITYARVVCLKHNGSNNGTLLATCDQHVWVDDEQVWPIYRSTNDGASWSFLTNVTDEQFGTNRKAQPMLYELPQDVGNLSAGTLLLAGNLVPDDESSSRIVIYKSTDLGATWEYLSTVDTGGPFDYDRSPESTTTTIWEPFLYMDDYGHLICAFSDERQKEDGVLQALSLRYSSDGLNWSDEQNIVAIGNSNDRPGMVTVAKMDNGKYIATYEVVNRPSYDQNSSVVYCKFSDDGLNWEESDLGTLVATSDGQCLGSSPYVVYTSTGGPNGMVIIGAKWVVNSSGDIQEGGQNLFVNYDYGNGVWERLPNAITWDGEDITYLDAFSQCLETNVSGNILYQIANIGDSESDSSALKFGAIPLTASVYEAENGNLNNVQIISCEDASNLYEVGYINYSDSYIEFDNVYAPSEGTYQIYVRYNNGDESSATHTITVNDSDTYTISYPKTPNWHQYYWSIKGVTLNAGLNTIKFGYNTGYAEIDCIEVYKSGSNLANAFMLENRNSSKYAEVASMSTDEGEGISQYDITYYPCQVWLINQSGNYYTFTNKNSGLLLDVNEASTEDGAMLIQNEENSNNSQLWSVTESDDGYFYIKNKNSSKYMEVMNNSNANGAVIDQWGSTGYSCQEWRLVKEGIQ